jgi:hypothetical protein
MVWAGAVGEKAARVWVITVPENECHVTEDMVGILLENFFKEIK